MIGTPEQRAMALKIARGFLKKLPCSVLREDIEQAALIGLHDGLRKHGADGNPFYLRIRIRGSIIDELRAQDWLPRRARAEWEHPAHVLHFDDVNEDFEASFPSKSESPDAALLRKAELESLRDAIAAAPLKPRDRQVILLFLRGLTQRQIAETFCTSEPRVSQLWHRALGILRKCLPSDPSDSTPISPAVPESPAMQEPVRRQPSKPNQTAPAPSFLQRIRSGDLGACASEMPKAPELDAVPSVLPPEGLDLFDELTRYRDWLLEQALIRTANNKREAAHLLGICEASVYNFLKGGKVDRLPRDARPKATAEGKPDPVRILADRLPREQIAEWREQGHCNAWICGRLATKLETHRYTIEKALRLLDEEAA